jgi:serine/threonine-protein kinase
VADIGSMLGGRYRLMELLGQGGMATIYRANDRQLGRDVAVKVLRPEYGDDPDFLGRFRQEAQAAASLNHPNVVAVYDYGDDPAGPYIVMELVEGEDLASLVRRNGPLAPRQAARLGAQIARGLAAAHERGIVHRDVKTGNVLLTPDGRAKVVDFGIARAIAEAQLTLPGTTLGSVHYFSPEQARGETATSSSDVYSLGVVIYELLTGRRPWEGDSAAAVAMARLSGPIPAPSDVRPGVPPALDAIVWRALARDPAERFPSAAAMADALDGVLAGTVQAATTGAAAAAGAAGSAAGAAAAGAPIGAATGAAGAATVASGVARSGPVPPVPYASDAYADRPPAPAPPPHRTVVPPPPDEADERGTGPWPWIAGLLGLLILAAVAFLAYQLLSGPGTPPAEQVSVPNFVGKTLPDAQTIANQAGVLIQTASFVPATSGQQEGTITAQDPPPNATVDRGATVRLTVVAGQQLVAVPDVRNQPEAQALNAITSAGLMLGDRSEEASDTVAAGSIITTSPGPFLTVAPGTPISWVVSTGPEPTPSPSPSPSPTPTPTPTEPPATPTPTPTPTEPPATPTPPPPTPTPPPATPTPTPPPATPTPTPS